MPKSILLYKGQGVSLSYARLIWNELKNSTNYTLHWVGKEQLSTTSWEEQAAAIIIPGGQDVFYHEALSGSINERIRAFVSNGGSYIGICAGAYYGCSLLEFDVGHPYEVTGTRELDFFPGIARGPAFGYGTYSYENESGGCVAVLDMPNGKSLASYYNGGCYFENAQTHDNVSVLARYRNIEGMPAAVVKCVVGKGVAILSGVHPEVTATNMQTADSYFQAMKPELEAVEEQRQALWELCLMNARVSLK